MSVRRWIGLIVVIILIGTAAGWYWLPDIVRHVAISRIQALTNRTATIARVDVNVLTGRFVVRDFHLTERDGRTPFVDFRELDVRVRLASLFAGHVWIRELILSDSTVRVVRLGPDEFNISDLIGRSGTTGKRLDVTVDRFALLGGTVTLEDRAAPEPRTWASERITIDARNLSTRRDGGTAVATSVTAGAPVRVDVRNLRLHPIHGEAAVTVNGLDLSVVRAYLPPNAAVVLERGRGSTSLVVALDAREGVRVDGTARFQDVTVVKRDSGERLALVPELAAEIRGFAVRDGALRLDRLGAQGTMSVRDPTGRERGPLRLEAVRASIADLTWPATTPGRLDIQTSIPGGGTLTVAGMVRPPPASTDVRVRLADLDLAPWAWLVPVTARITGLAQADLRINEPLGAGIPTRVHGSITVNRLGVADGREQVVGARRVEASGLELHWPTRVVARTITVTGPRGVLERDRDGRFPARDLLALRARPASEDTRPAKDTAVAIDVGEVVVRGGALAWRDHAVVPPVRLDLSRIDARVTGIGWPLRGPAGVRMSFQTPGGGQLHATGHVGLVAPAGAEVQLVAKNAALGPYQSYLRTPARVSGTTDFDLAVVVPSLAEPRAKARGSFGVARLDVHDHERTVMRVERATAAGLDVEWPERITVARLTLAQPWAVIERDDKGALPLRALLTPRVDAGANPATPTGDDGGEGVSITVADLRVDGGGLRIVDRAVSPAFAVDFQPVRLRATGLTTAPETRPARVELAGQLGPGAELTLRGTVGAIGGPLRLDVNGELRDFALPRTNPYLLQQAGWKTTDGRLTTKLRCRIDGDALSARTDIRLSRVDLIRAAPEDHAQARFGLPLRMITSLMKDKHGDITLSFPIGGRVSDPRFDFSEAIWNAVRTVAVNAITLPVSWIGRVRFTPDSRIERIDVDPIPFEPGVPTLTPAGHAHVERLAAFFRELPEVKMAVTPVVSPRDVAEIERGSRERAVDRRGSSPQDERASRPTESAIGDLAERRVDAVRAELKEAGIDPDRLVVRDFVERDESRIELEVIEPDAPRPSRTREILRRIGMPIRDAKD